MGGVQLDSPCRVQESIATEAARIQDRLTDEGAETPARDVLVPPTARSTGDELVVAGGDFDAHRLSTMLDVVQLAT